MRRIQILISVLIIFHTARAQDEFMNFSPPSGKELDLKECLFDKEAEAVIFFDMAFVNFDDEYQMITEHKVKLKILKENGTRLGNITIPFYSDGDFETIYDVNALVWNQDGRGRVITTSFDRKSVYRRKINSLYSEVTFALPEIKTGSIIEYHYKSQQKSYGALKRWEFQQELPVVKSYFKLIIIPNVEFSYSVYKNSSLNVDVKQDPSTGSITFGMENIPGLRQEAYMDAANDYLQRVEFQLSGYNTRTSVGYTTGVDKVKLTNNWQALNCEMLSSGDYGGQLNKKLEGAKELEAQWERITDPFEKMKTIHHFVRNNFNWNNIWSLESTEGLKKIWEKKSGSSTDLNLILVNLLKQSGLDVNPMLVSERHHGKVDTTNPLKSQFNKTVALVRISHQNYVLDASERVTPSHMIPLELLNTKGFIVDKKESGFLLITDNSRMHRNHVNIAGSIGKEGLVNAKADLYFYDYAKVETLKGSENNIRSYLRQLVENSGAGLTPDSLAIKGDENDSVPLQCHLEYRQQLSKTGDYFVINYNQLNDFYQNPFLKEYRFSDINFGSRYSYTVAHSYTLAPDLVPDALPSNSRLVSEDRSLMASRQISYRDGKLEILIRIEFNRSHFEAAEYMILKTFYKKMFELLNEPIVLKTTKS